MCHVSTSMQVRQIHLEVSCAYSTEENLVFGESDRDLYSQQVRARVWSERRWTDLTWLHGVNHYSDALHKCEGFRKSL